VTPIVSINYDNGTGKKQRSLQNQLQINNKIAPQHIKPFCKFQIAWTSQPSKRIMWWKHQANTEKFIYSFPITMMNLLQRYLNFYSQRAILWKMA